MCLWVCLSPPTSPSPLYISLPFPAVCVQRDSSLVAEVVADEPLTPDGDGSPQQCSGSARPQFLFPRNHSQSFIEVQNTPYICYLTS